MCIHGVVGVRGCFGGKGCVHVKWLRFDNNMYDEKMNIIYSMHYIYIVQHSDFDKLLIYISIIALQKLVPKMDTH